MSNKKYTILYVDDEPQNLRTFKATFKWDYKIHTARSAFEGLDVLAEQPVDLIISDQRMAGLSGIEFFKKVIKKYPEPLRIILTGYSEMNVIVRAVNEVGIYQFMSKPWREEEMKQTMENALEVYQLRRDNQQLIQELAVANETLAAENSYLRAELDQAQQFDEIITSSPQFQQLLQTITKVATTNTTVLIRGESGTGKELMARALHNFSQRKDQPFIKVNCAALPATLIESELFGHEKGAFTGATSRRAGRFEMANSGTIFLDEIGEMPLDLQSKLLRVLQEGEFERLGGSETIKVNVRVLAATNRQLEKEIADKKFREDLFYRLNVFPVINPPLRERKEDIPALVQHFLKKYESNIGRRIHKIPAATLKKLQAYDWPGNIRELENIVERFMITSFGDALELDSWHPPKADLSKRDAQSGRFLTLEEIEIQHIKAAIERANGKISGAGGAAELLGMHPNTLSSRMAKFGIKK
ncbi:MAG: sigma-54-dependent transcriptional regulator [Saprospiraceae bacterium]